MFELFYIFIKKNVYKYYILIKKINLNFYFYILSFHFSLHLSNFVMCFCHLLYLFWTVIFTLVPIIVCVKFLVMLKP